MRILTYGNFDSPSSFHSPRLAKTTRNHVEERQNLILSLNRVMEKVKFKLKISRGFVKVRTFFPTFELSANTSTIEINFFTSCTSMCAARLFENAICGSSQHKRVKGRTFCFFLSLFLSKRKSEYNKFFVKTPKRFNSYKK